MATTTMSVRLPEELSRQLNKLAEATKRSKSFCAVEAIKRYVEQESWQVMAVEEGINDAAEGRLVDHQEVKDWVTSWDSGNEASPPQCK